MSQPVFQYQGRFHLALPPTIESDRLYPFDSLVPIRSPLLILSLDYHLSPPTVEPDRLYQFETLTPLLPPPIPQPINEFYLTDILPAFPERVFMEPFIFTMKPPTVPMEPVTQTRCFNANVLGVFNRQAGRWERVA